MNTNKPVLMIHEFKESFLDLPLEDYILTFDDGLYSQYQYISELQKIPTQKIFFITTGIICPEDQLQSSTPITCSEAHKKAFNGNFEDYMTWDQIRHLHSLPDCTIGAHSHNHCNLGDFNSLVQKTRHINSDTTHMIASFNKNIAHTPTHFCHPYNDDLSGFYNGLLLKFGFTHFYANERIDIINF